AGARRGCARVAAGADPICVAMVRRAFELWQEYERRWKRKLYHRTGAVWMVTGPDEFVRPPLPLLSGRGFPYQEISTADARRRWPQIDFEGVRWVLHEERAGYLLA